VKYTHWTQRVKSSYRIENKPQGSLQKHLYSTTYCMRTLNAPPKLQCLAVTETVTLACICIRLQFSFPTFSLCNVPGSGCLEKTDIRQYGILVADTKWRHQQRWADCEIFQSESSPDPKKLNPIQTWSAKFFKIIGPIQSWLANVKSCVFILPYEAI